jgi:hypothetical protein
MGTIDPGLVKLDQLDKCQTTHVRIDWEVETRNTQADLGR